MALTNIFALLQDAAPQVESGGSASMVRIAAGVLALVLVLIIVFRRKGGAKKEKEEEEF